MVVGANKDTSKRKIMKHKLNAVPSSSILEIDMNELDVEWGQQPKYYHEYAIQRAQAQRKLDEAEAELKVVKAEVDRAIRDAPSKYNLADKPTEASIASTIFLQPRYQKAQSIVIASQEHVNIIDAMVRSLDHKKAALENMVRLHGMDYFSSPKVDSENERKINEQRSNKVAKMCAKDRR